MIDPSLLARLQKADPGAHNAWKIMHDVYSIREGSAMSDAWLQHVLQDTIAAKGWFYWIQWDTNYGNVAGVNKEHPDKEYMCDDADSPAEALLKCYLAAVKG